MSKVVKKKDPFKSPTKKQMENRGLDVNGHKLPKVEKLANIREQIKKLKEEADQLTGVLIEHLRDYNTITQGQWSAGIDVTERRSPRWKEAFLYECGDDKAAEVVANTKPSQTEKIIIFKKGRKVS